MIQPTRPDRRFPGSPERGSNERPERGPNEPYPDVRGAFMLTLLAMLTAALIGVFFIGLGTLTAVGIGQALGVGAIATMAARRVSEPQSKRLGLRGLEAHDLPTILCLAPAILLASELDNFAADASRQATPNAESTFIESEVLEEPAPPVPLSDPESETGNRPFESDAETGTNEELARPLIDPDDPWSLIQAFIIFVGISPVVEEFLFRGVIQQGLLSRLGLVRGIGVVALLWTLLRPAPVDDLGRFFAAAVASFGLGCALGIVRVATGSILGSILLASLWGAVGLGSIALQGRIDLPGMNVEATHLPWTVSFASACIVAWAGWSLYLEAEQRFSQENADATARPPTSHDEHGGGEPGAPGTRGF